MGRLVFDYGIYRCAKEGIMYKVGMKIRIIDMAGEPQYSGNEGVIQFIDSMGQLHGTWGGCAVIPSEDSFVVLKDK